MKKIVSFIVLGCMIANITGCNGKTSGGKSSQGIDLDLTTLSGTMVYSKVYEMTREPENDMGKIIKMEGKCAYYKDPKTKKEYYTCIIQDATQCCAQGIEFELKKKYNKYPRERENIVVQGKFDAYREKGQTYCVVRNADLVKK